ncbi:TldD/PmbA family protein [Paremcibacter congregatus]|uniref:Modulator protein n=1 Tax=Paremcibacter congregatus TaxID=2043170 RepID=A0A2G4YRV0_9PROT|nr:metallopeptidase TldD-related protein [Paremcibacter congregatus]PHZ84990.1 modulator protein [Paremcibacter congregatus]QDE26034.1 TldD/PmbA family protein [Paremcibacter congregatus]|tara:strand:+ start:4679 stop:6046 length:1368 start_codon:yes stop_codon:yes gene_type:complete
MPSDSTKKADLFLEKLDYLITAARKAGADASDAVIYEGQSQSVSWRLGALEDVERAESTDLGLRVLVGHKQALISSSDINDATLDTLVERAMDMARNAPEDPYAGLADPALLALSPKDIPDLDLYDDTVKSADEMQALARTVEETALATEGITNSEGASASSSSGLIATANSNGFAGHYQSSHFALSISVIAGTDDKMERDYAYSSKRHFMDLRDPAAIGHEAAEKTLRRLGARQAKTCKASVIFDPRVSRSLLGHLAGAINGQAIARGTSFLKDRMEEQIFSPGITVIDNPHILRGPSSKPFDGEGCRNAPLDVVTDGILKCWILDSSSARQLGLTANGRASRGTSSPPSPSTTNLYIAAGSLPPEELYQDIKQGLYVTDLIGMGVNGVTGDYSRGASGFWIEDGKISYPVNEITIAGNLKDMFLQMTAADDLVLKYGTDAPTLRVDGMMVAGA